MSIEALAPILSFAGIVITTVITTIATSRDTRKRIDSQNEITNYKLDELIARHNSLVSKVEKHNNFDRRIIVLETELKSLKERDTNDGK